jgi:acylphosphatase
MSDNNIQVHLFISGRVQGVGYRFWTQRQAEKLGINGWVKNLADGRVEAVFMGKQEVVEQMIELCNYGPRLAQVTGVFTNSEIPESFTNFQIH